MEGPGDGESYPEITEALLRKRSEHNEGCLSNLKEVTLHQFNIERIGPVLGTLCRELEILFLQNNLISNIENLQHLKELKYLNLAINNVSTIENLESCESLSKLDLTCNFVSVATLHTVARLAANYNLVELHLTGNPCTSFPGYKEYVIHAIPSLKVLDSQEITRSERILAAQHFPQVSSDLAIAAKDEGDEAPKEAKYNEKGERLYGNTAEERLAAHREMEEIRKKKSDQQTVNADEIGTTENIGKPSRRKGIEMTPDEELEKYGRIIQRNEGSWDFRFDESDSDILLDIALPKHLDTQLIDVDVNPTFVRCVVKGKVLQLSLDEEVYADRATAQRSQTTGGLLLKMPRVHPRVRKEAARATSPSGIDDADQNGDHSDSTKTELLEVSEKAASIMDQLVLDPQGEGQRKNVGDSGGTNNPHTESGREDDIPDEDLPDDLPDLE